MHSIVQPGLARRLPLVEQSGLRKFLTNTAQSRLFVTESIQLATAIAAPSSRLSF